MTTKDRAVAVKRALDAVRAREDLRARRGSDPINFVHEFRSQRDRELVALVAANLAFGNVKAIRRKVRELLDRLGPSPSRASEDEASLHQRLDGFKHRVFKGEDVARLLFGARSLQREAGSLGAAFAAELDVADRALPRDEEAALREALASFCDRIRRAGGLPIPGATLKKTDRRGPMTLVPGLRSRRRGR